MKKILGIDASATLEYFVVANAPAFLHHKLKQHPVVSGLSTRPRAALLSLAAKALRDPPKNLAQYAVPFLCVAALSAQGDSESIANLSGKEARYHRWFQEFCALANSDIRPTLRKSIHLTITEQPNARRRPDTAENITYQLSVGHR